MSMEYVTPDLLEELEIENEFDLIEYWRDTLSPEGIVHVPR